MFAAISVMLIVILIMVYVLYHQKVTPVIVDVLSRVKSVFSKSSIQEEMPNNVKLGAWSRGYRVRRLIKEGKITVEQLEEIKARRKALKINLNKSKSLTEIDEILRPPTSPRSNRTDKPMSPTRASSPEKFIFKSLDSKNSDEPPMH